MRVVGQLEDCSMKAGDVVRKHGEDNLMTVERVEGLKIFVCWFDEKEKLRKLCFWQDDLLLVAYSSAGNMGLK